MSDRVISTITRKNSGDVVAIDGKTYRKTKTGDSVALHTLNAWSVGNRLVLGQLAVEEKSNEITAVPKLMDMCDLKGCIVTTDALNCQKLLQIAIEQKSDYILTVKRNQKNLYTELIKSRLLHERRKGGSSSFSTLEVFPYSSYIFASRLKTSILNCISLFSSNSIPRSP